MDVLYLYSKWFSHRVGGHSPKCPYSSPQSLFGLGQQGIASNLACDCFMGSAMICNETWASPMNRDGFKFTLYRPNCSSPYSGKHCHALRSTFCNFYSLVKGLNRQSICPVMADDPHKFSRLTHPELGQIR